MDQDNPNFELCAQCEHPDQMNNAVAAYNQGKVDTLVQLYTNTADCKIATVSLGNVTRQVADVECIQKVLSEQNRTR